MIRRREEIMGHHLSLIEKIDLLMKEEAFIYGNNPRTYSERTKDKYYQELKDALEQYNKKYLEDLGANFIRMNFSHLLIQKSESD